MSIADQTSYEVIYLKKGKPIKAWVRGVSLEPEARQQLINLAGMPFIHKHVAVMPDAHLGKGATVGSVIPTLGAIIPAAVGVDIGCGMIAVRTQFTAGDVHGRGDLATLRESVERSIRCRPGNITAGSTTARPPPRLQSLSGISRPTVRRRSRRTGGSSWAAWARATTSSRSASMR